MQLARLNHTAGNKRRCSVNYGNWLPDGVNVVTFTATVISSLGAATNVVVTGISIVASKVIFFVAGGVANETFTIAVQMVDSYTQIKNDTIYFTVVAP